jgi:hypothetical protein
MPELVKQATVFYSFGAKIGWTERYFMTATTYSVAKDDVDSLVTKRLALSCPDVKVDYVRVSDVGVRGDSVVAPAPGLVGTYTAGAAPAVSTEPWTALNVRMEGGTLYRGRKFIHGLPQFLMTGNIFTPDSPWNTAFNAYAAALLATTCLWVRDRSAVQALPPAAPIMTKVTLTQIWPLGTTSHRVGRPFGLPVGRRQRV